MQYDKTKTLLIRFLCIKDLEVEDIDFLIPHFKIVWDNCNDFLH